MDSAACFRCSPEEKYAHGAAMFRAGLKELSSIFAAFPESVQPVEEYGLAGNALPQEVHTNRHGKGQAIDQNIEMER